MKRLGQWLSLLGLLSIGALATAQENYPSRVISIMVPYAAGAASDFTARTLNDLIARQVGGQAIVENLPGASGAIAANKVLAAPADGYYVFQGSPNELILASLVNKSTRYRSEDFQWVAPVAVSPLVVVVNGAEIESVMRQVLETGEPVIDTRSHGHTPGDPEHEHAWSASYFRLEEPGGKILGVSSTIVDVTEHFRAESLAATAQERLTLRVDAAASEIGRASCRERVL